MSSDRKASVLRGQQSQAGPCTSASVRAVPWPSHQNSEPLAGDVSDQPRFLPCGRKVFIAYPHFLTCG